MRSKSSAKPRRHGGWVAVSLVALAALAPFGCERMHTSAPKAPAAVTDEKNPLDPTEGPTTESTPFATFATASATPAIPTPPIMGAPAPLEFEQIFGGLGKRKEILRIEPRKTTLTSTESLLAKKTVSKGTRLVFLNRKGGTYKPGGSSANTNSTSITDKVGTITPYEKGDAAWAKLSACVRGQFTRWDLQFTEDDPAGKQEHIEVVIGGHPSVFGMENTVAGVAAMVSDCSVNDDSIAFVFSKVYGAKDAQQECETAAHELGHVLGLDHAFYCPDPMTYLEGCGNKVFRNQAVSCGTNKARACACGATQNSVAVLDKNAGLASNGGGTIDVPGPGGVSTISIPTSFPTSTTPPKPTATTPPKPTASTPPKPTASTPPKPTPPKGDGKGPVITLIGPADATKLSTGSQVAIVAQVQDPAGVGKVFLEWRMGSELTTIDCDKPGAGITCNQGYGTWAFRLPAGKGTRTWSIRATDKSGNESVSEQRTIVLSDDAAPGTPPMPSGVPIPPAPTSAAPTALEATLVSPDDGKVHHWGETVTVKVSVKGVASSVQVVWRSAFGDEMQALSKGEGDTWTGTMTIPKLSLPGPRQLRAVATSASGASVETPSKTITIMP